VQEIKILFISYRWRSSSHDWSRQQRCCRVLQARCVRSRTATRSSAHRAQQRAQVVDLRLRRLEFARLRIKPAPQLVLLLVDVGNLTPQSVTDAANKQQRTCFSSSSTYAFLRIRDSCADSRFYTTATIKHKQCNHTTCLDETALSFEFLLLVDGERSRRGQSLCVHLHTHTRARALVKKCANTKLSPHAPPTSHWSC
jgi:hypothetical protein